MPATLSVKKDGAYVVGASSGAKIKVAGAYVDATNVRIKANGAYSNPGSLPANTTPPVIAGTLATGEELTVTPGTWTGNPTPALLHRWEADGVGIPGARGLTYTLTVNEAGKSVRCVEIGVNSNGAAAVDSNALTIPVVLGPERLLDPSFDAGDGEWNTTGWVFGSGQVELKSPPSPGVEVYTIETTAVRAGRRYQFSMVVSAINGAQLRFNHGDGTIFTTTGTHTQLVDVAADGAAGIICQNIAVTATVTSMSVKEVL